VMGIFPPTKTYEIEESMGDICKICFSVQGRVMTIDHGFRMSKGGRYPVQFSKLEFAPLLDGSLNYDVGTYSAAKGKSQPHPPVSEGKVPVQSYVGSKVIFFDPVDRTIVVYNEDFKKKDFPGGQHEPGETPVDTAIRELREELGVSIYAEQLVYLGRSDEKGPTGGMEEFWARSFVYGCILPAALKGHGKLEFIPCPQTMKFVGLKTSVYQTWFVRILKDIAECVGGVTQLQYMLTNEGPIPPGDRPWYRRHVSSKRQVEEFWRGTKFYEKLYRLPEIDSCKHIKCTCAWTVRIDGEIVMEHQPRKEMERSHRTKTIAMLLGVRVSREKI